MYTSSHSVAISIKVFGSDKPPVNVFEYDCYVYFDFRVTATWVPSFFPAINGSMVSIVLRM